MQRVKRCLTAAALLAIMLGTTWADAASRKWTSADGKFAVQAEVLSVSNGKVELRKLNGDTIQVPLEKLSDVDREWIKTAFPESAEGKTAGSGTGAASCSLDLKKIDLLRAPTGSRSPLDAYGRLCTPQHFYLDLSSRASTPRSSHEQSEFRAAIKKEPTKYQARQPFRGVATLNGRDYGFVFDMSTPASPGFDRLYFDINGNGDLTDDRPITGEVKGVRNSATTVFPRIELPIATQGVNVDYAIFMNVHSYASDQFAYASASLTPAAYREGRINLGGRRRHLVLLDSNSNGLFGDEAKPPSRGGMASIVPGDTFLFDPETSAGPTRSGVSGMMEGKCYVSKIISVDGRFFDCQVAPAGDRVTLAPSTASIGYATNPNGFNAVVYNEQGIILNISGGKPRIPLPEGSWRLASYTMDQFAVASRASTPSKQPKSKKSAAMEAAPRVLAAPAAGATVRGVVVVALGTAESPSVAVHKDGVVPFPFGPPYKAVVTTGGDRGKTGTVRLSLLLTGAGGERCTSLMLANGSRPTPPAFTILNARGDIVERGQFEFG